MSALLDKWYQARRAAGYPACPYYEAMIDEVIEEMLDEQLPHPDAH